MVRTKPYSSYNLPDGFQILFQDPVTLNFSVVWSITALDDEQRERTLPVVTQIMALCNDAFDRGLEANPPLCTITTNQPFVIQ